MERMDNKVHELIGGQEITLASPLYHRTQDDARAESSEEDDSVGELESLKCVGMKRRISQMEERLQTQIQRGIKGAEERLQTQIERGIKGAEERLQTQIERGLTGAVKGLKDFVVKNMAPSRVQGETQVRGDQWKTTSQEYSGSDSSSTNTDLEDRDANGERPKKRVAYPGCINPFAHATSSPQGEQDSPESLSASTKGGSSEGSGASQQTLTPTDLVDVWTKSLEKIITTIEKPKQPLPTFTGESRREFGLFMKQFHQYMYKTSVDPSSRLDMLISACTGPLKESLRGYVSMGPVEGYHEAMDMLTRRLGSTEEHIDEAVMEITMGPSINDNDVQMIRGFVQQIWNCITDLEIAGRLSDLDNFGSITYIANRFTGKLRERYEDRLHDYLSKSNTRSRPGIVWLRDLLDDYVRRMQRSASFSQVDSKGGNKAEKSTPQQGHSGYKASETPMKKRVVGLATAEKETHESSPNGKNKRWHPCVLCQNLHPLYACQKFRSMNMPDRWAVAKRAKVCFACLGHNHTIPECKSPYRICGIDGCSQLHSRWLHNPEKREKLGKREDIRVVKWHSPEPPEAAKQDVKQGSADE